MKLKSKIVILLILVAGTHCVLYLAFFFLANNKNELLIRSAAYKKVSNKCKVLFLGDSHGQRGVDFKDMGDDFFSMAFDGENNIMNYYKLKYYLENYPGKPAYVLLPCDLVSFAKGYNLHRTNTFFYYSFIHFSELPNFENDLPAAYYRFFKIKIFPYSDWQYGINTANSGHDLHEKEKFSDQSKKERENNAIHFIQQELMCDENKQNLFFKTAITYLKKTIDLCKFHQVKIVFIKFPITNTLLNEVKYHVDSTYLVNRPSEKIIEAQKIPILNFEKVFINKQELFFDCHHLNIYGKETFTPLLRQKLDSLLKVY